MFLTGSYSLSGIGRSVGIYKGLLCGSVARLISYSVMGSKSLPLMFCSGDELGGKGHDTEWEERRYDTHPMTDGGYAQTGEPRVAHHRIGIN